LCHSLSGFKRRPTSEDFAVRQVCVIYPAGAGRPDDEKSVDFYYEANGLKNKPFYEFRAGPAVMVRGEYEDS
jgi:hypothetical protein